MQQKTSFNFLKKKKIDKHQLVLVLVVSVAVIGFFINDCITKNLFTGVSLWIKVGGLGACILYSIILTSVYPNKDTCLLTIAMIFTGIGDYCLTINDWFVEGVLAFAVVHTIYIWRHGEELSKGKKIKIMTFFFIMLIIMGSIMMTLKERLYQVAMWYGAILLTSVYTAILQRKTMNGKVKCIGIILFFLCDICVGLYNLTIGMPQLVVGILIWLFYEPAQLMLALSGDYKKMKGNRI